ncbi:hypothetical protein CKF54_04175 [Psittacicella hinzii]|uniref:Uncharacterized protein n=1 Tax=Psittacicella hinzii TaxID=2028575 RepID=A0A3A1Y6B8_9GAMM|nr:hypothetical protein [Psittacicella hinzii]RIY32809.1 hypothetical protein CKF54_04175 [Psittacicella hinzii]
MCCFVRLDILQKLNYPIANQDQIIDLNELSPLFTLQENAKDLNITSSLLNQYLYLEDHEIISQIATLLEKDYLYQPRKLDLTFLQKIGKFIKQITNLRTLGYSKPTTNLQKQILTFLKSKQKQIQLPKNPTNINLLLQILQSLTLSYLLKQPLPLAVFIDGQLENYEAYSFVFNLEQGSISFADLILQEEHPNLEVYHQLGDTLAQLQADNTFIFAQQLDSLVYSNKQWFCLDFTQVKIHPFTQEIAGKDLQTLLDTINIFNQKYQGYFFLEDWQAIIHGYEND